jgi:Calcineurin-like phosphoesterase
VDGVPGRVGIAGDWHGNAAWAVRTIRKISALLPRHGPRIILHLGDFGIWPGPDGRDYLARLDAALAAASAGLCFVDGNHEDFTQLAGLRPGPDGREQVTSRLALGGAVSLDRAVRTAGVNWWPEEEITWRQAGSVIDAGPADVMVTHECPAGTQSAAW